jgi:hypothetical protein
MMLKYFGVRKMIKNSLVINKIFIYLILSLCIGCNEREKPKVLTKLEFSSLIDGFIKPEEIDNYLYKFEGSRTGYTIYSKIIVKHNFMIKEKVKSLEKMKQYVLSEVDIERIQELKKNNSWKLDISKSNIYRQDGKNSWTSSFIHYWFVPKDEDNTLYIMGWGI